MKDSFSAPCGCYHPLGENIEDDNMHMHSYESSMSGGQRRYYVEEIK